MSQRIILTGGGTGGHIYPLVAIAEEIVKQAGEQGIKVELELMGDGEIIVQEAVRLAEASTRLANLNIKFKRVFNPKWRSYFSIWNFLDLWKLPVGIIQSFFHIWVFMPDVIFAKGHGSLLPALAGRIMAVPLMIHESDAIPGRTNQFLAHIARKVFGAFESSRPYFKAKEVEIIGNPIRVAIGNLANSNADKAAARQVFALDPVKPAALITGASQGAKVLNDILALSIIELLKKFQVIHQTGPRNFDEVNKQMNKLLAEGKNTYGEKISAGYRVYPFLTIEQMVLAYSAADVIVSRAGSQIFETAAVGLPTVLIPLKHSSQNHQLANAKEAAKFGATVIEEDNLTPHVFINEIEKAYEQRTVRSEQIKQFAKPEAAGVIAKQLLAISG